MMRWSLGFLALPWTVLGWMACSGGQSFDDGGDPILLTDLTDLTEGTADSGAPSSNDPADGGIREPSIALEDAGPPSLPSSAPTEAVTGEPSTERPTTDSSEPVSPPTDDGGATPTAPESMPPALALPPGPSESLGSIEFAFSVQEPDRYCTYTGSTFSVLVEDEQGNLFNTAATPNQCGARPCTSCVLADPCQVTDVYYPMRFGAGGTTTWRGQRVVGSLCSADGATQVCAAEDYAPSGNYVAIFCATLGEANESTPDECRYSGLGQECMRVPFEYPGDQVVTGELPIGGSDPDAWTFACGNQSCSIDDSYCLDRTRFEPLSYSCEALPDACVTDRTCACLGPLLPTGQGCIENVVDGALRVLVTL